MRIVLAYLLIGVRSLLGIFGFHGWPFSTFPMYSNEIKKMINYHLVIEKFDGKREIVDNSRILWPLGTIWLSKRMEKIIEKENSSELTKEILTYYCNRLRIVKGEEYFNKVTSLLISYNEKSIYYQDCHASH